MGLTCCLPLGVTVVILHSVNLMGHTLRPPHGPWHWRKCQLHGPWHWRTCQLHGPWHWRKCQPHGPATGERVNSMGHGSQRVKGLRRCEGSKMALRHYCQWLIQQLVLPYTTVVIQPVTLRWCRCAHSWLNRRVVCCTRSTLCLKKWTTFIFTITSAKVNQISYFHY